MKRIVVDSLNCLDVVLLLVRGEFNRRGSCNVYLEEEENEKQRTLSQNASLHKYCDNLSKMMNEAGFTQNELIGSFKDGFTLPITEHMIKDIFRTVGKAMYKKESTKDLTTTEIQDIYRVVDARFGEVAGVRCEWPSRESQMRV